MVAIPLKGGAYTAQSLIANAQRSVNLYPEANPDTTSPNQPVTHYPRPGLRVLSAPAPPSGGAAPTPPVTNVVLANDADTVILNSESGPVLTPP